MVEDARDATADDRLSDWRLDTVVVASVEVPVTVSVPLLTNDDVAVIDPPVIVLPVIVLKNEVTLLRIVAMRPVEVVVLVTVRFEEVSAVAEALPRLVCPVTVRVPDVVRLVVEALPSVVFPVTSSVPPTVWLPVIVEVPMIMCIKVLNKFNILVR
jgi:hypothetical protein